MKKIIFTLLLMLTLSISIFADEGGDLPGGGKTCPNGQTTCREVPADDSFIKIIFNDLLISIFG